MADTDNEIAAETAEVTAARDEIREAMPFLSRVSDEQAAVSQVIRDSGYNPNAVLGSSEEAVSIRDDTHPMPDESDLLSDPGFRLHVGEELGSSPATTENTQEVVNPPFPLTEHEVPQQPRSRHRNRVRQTAAQRRQAAAVTARVQNDDEDDEDDEDEDENRHEEIPKILELTLANLTPPKYQNSDWLRALSYAKMFEKEGWSVICNADGEPTSIKLPRKHRWKSIDGKRILRVDENASTGVFKWSIIKRQWDRYPEIKFSRPTDTIITVDLHKFPIIPDDLEENKDRSDSLQSMLDERNIFASVNGKLVICFNATVSHFIEKDKLPKPSILTQAHFTKINDKEYFFFRHKKMYITDYPELRSDIFELIETQEIDSSRFVEHFVKVISTANKNKVIDLQKEITELQNTLITTQHQLGHARFINRAVEQASNEVFNELLDKLKTIPNVLEVRLFASNIQIITRPIFWTNSMEGGVIHFFGQYEINLYLESGISVRNLNARGLKKTIHPHMFDGSTCLGGFTHLIASAFRDLDYYTVMLASVEYLSDMTYTDNVAREYLYLFKRKPANTNETSEYFRLYSFTEGRRNNDDEE